MLKGLYVLDENSFKKIYDKSGQKEINNYVDIYAPPQTAESIRKNLSLLQEAQVIFSGWGGPRMDKEFLDAAPELKAVFYGAGSIKGIVTEEFWDRDIIITSSYAANGLPVAEYTVSQILFSLKRGWFFARRVRNDGNYKSASEKDNVPGTYRSKVGIVSLGMIGRYVCQYLRNFDVQVLAYDPYVSQEDVKKLDVELCSLENLFNKCDVVSLHTPWLKETEGMITGSHLLSMKKNATFINTSRGAIVREKEMIEVLQKRPDIFAVLDVTYPEPPEKGSPLYKLTNVVLTPHIAGSINGECSRLGKYMVEELKCYIKGDPLKWRINKEKAGILA